MKKRKIILTEKKVKSSIFVTALLIILAWIYRGTQVMPIMLGIIISDLIGWCLHLCTVKRRKN